LRAQERLALLDLVGLRIAIARWSALQNIAYVDVLAAKTHGEDHLGEQLAGAADERLAQGIFVRARGPSGQHEIGVLAPHAVDQVGTLRGQLAALAVAELGADRREREPRTARSLLDHHIFDHRLVARAFALAR